MSSFKKYKEMSKDSMYSQVLPEFDMNFKSTILIGVLIVGIFPSELHTPEIVLDFTINAKGAAKEEVTRRQATDSFLSLCITL